MLGVRWEPAEGCEQRRGVNGLGFNRIPPAVCGEKDVGLGQEGQRGGSCPHLGKK